jgi:hypothetical protein
LSLNVYFANFTSRTIVTALSDSNGNQGQITRGSNFVSGSLVAAGFTIPPNTISPPLGVIDNTSIGIFNQTPWDWMYFNLLNPDASVALELQAFLQIDDDSKLPTKIEVGPYDQSTSNSNQMPQKPYRTYGGGNGNGIWFILSDADLLSLSAPK